MLHAQRGTGEGFCRAVDLARASLELAAPLPASAAALLARLPPLEDLRAAIDFLERLCHLRRHCVMSRTSSEVLTLESFRFGTRIRRALRKGGIETIGRLLECRSADLLRLSGFGQGSLAEVRRALRSHGLVLRGEGSQARPA
jgi:hypothetical protein